MLPSREKRHNIFSRLTLFCIPRNIMSPTAKSKGKTTRASAGSERPKSTRQTRMRARQEENLKGVGDADDHDDYDGGSQLNNKSRSTSRRGRNDTPTDGKLNAELDLEEKENKESITISGSSEPFPRNSAIPMDLLSSNIVHQIYRHTTGQRFKQNLKQATIQPFVQQMSEFRVSHGASPFDRRVTALEWHPTHPTMLAVGSKGGDLMLWDYSKGQDGWNVVQGIGKGGSVQTLRHDLSDPSWIFTSSIDGMVSRYSFDGKTKRIYLNTCDWNKWYCSVDINYVDNVLTAGDNSGNVVLMSREGKELWSHRLHKQKVSHCEFNQRCPWLLATASNDKTVKMWDIRNISGKASFLYQMVHERPINSAYFSPDGTKLLTTEQHSQLRVYSGPLWDTLERTIIHPHRFFQHITPIKATWHPFQNLIVVGRYPDPALEGFEHDTVRSIDAYDVSSGELVCRLMDQCATGIQSLNVFNPSGDALATGMGLNTLIWQNADIRAQVREEKREIMRRQGKEPPPDEGPTTKAPKRQRSNNQKLTQKLQTMKKVKNSK